MQLRLDSSRRALGPSDSGRVLLHIAAAFEVSTKLKFEGWSLDIADDPAGTGDDDAGPCLDIALNIPINQDGIGENVAFNHRGFTQDECTAIARMGFANEHAMESRDLIEHGLAFDSGAFRNNVEGRLMQIFHYWSTPGSISSALPVVGLAGLVVPGVAAAAGVAESLGVSGLGAGVTEGLILTGAATATAGAGSFS
jgi:hypothetical protein